MQESGRQLPPAYGCLSRYNLLSLPDTGSETTLVPFTSDGAVPTTDHWGAGANVAKASSRTNPLKDAGHETYIKELR